MAELLDRLRSALGNRYRLERELGQGGMATVYLAHDLRHDREVAIKVLRPELAATLGTERFLQEIQIAARLTHPHILPLHDSGEAAGFLYYVMPYVEGESLRDKLTRESELPIPEALRILREVTDALAYAHGRGVIHRDIKPENVMLSGRHALVTDFGVAKALHEATGRQRLTTQGVALGTPAYMSPEQAAADPHLDHRADLYAVGAVGYELLTGRPPFTGTSPQMVLAAQVTEQPRPVTEHRPGVPTDLALTIMRCLEKKPADRWQAASELHAQLELLATTPSGGNTPTSTRPLEAVTLRPRSSRWLKLAAAVAILLGLAGGAWRLLDRRGKALDPNRVLVVPFDITGLDATLINLGLLIEASLTQGLQSTGLAQVVDSRSATSRGEYGGTSQRVIASPSGARHLAEAIGAGLIVTGRVLVVNDSLQIDARFADVRTGLDLVPIGILRGARSATAPLLLSLTQRVMGALALYRDPRWGGTEPGNRAPTYAAYREFQAGMDGWKRGEYPEAGKHYLKAFALDSTFMMALIRYGYTRFNMGDFAAVDSIGRVLDPLRSRLSPFETNYLIRLLAWAHGDLDGFLAAGREMARVAPKSVSAGMAAARSAIFLNRIAEAKEGLLKIDPASPELADADGWFEDIARVYHKLDDSKSELSLADRWIRDPQTRFPLEASFARMRALVSLGRLTDIEAGFGPFLTTRVEGNVRATVYAQVIVNELHWHGHEELSRRLSGEALARLGAELTPEERVGFLVTAERGKEAESIADSMLRGSPNEPAALGNVGVLAAIRGDRVKALNMLHALEALHLPYDRGRTPWERARITARLGDREEAVHLLQQAFAEGTPFLGNAFHAQLDFESLRTLPAFEVFVRPRD